MMWICEKCNLIYNYPVNICIYCGNVLKIRDSKKLIVKGTTKVLIPSSEHKNVPYFNLLLEDEFGQFSIKKSFEEYDVGYDIKTKNEQMVSKKKVGIIGTGLMGIELSVFLLKMGHEIILKTRSEESIKTALEKIQNILLKSLTKEETEKLLEKIYLSKNFSDLSETDIIIESVVENLNIKKNIFQELDEICSKNIILASNSSSMSIDEIASVTSNNKRVIGMHFFNPPEIMRLVEIVNGEKTSKETLESAIQFVIELNKVPIIVKNSPGFIVNRSLMPFINEAAYILESGISDAKDIDTAIRLGLNHPMGPLALADFIGLDICISIMEHLNNEFKNSKYIPCPIFYKLIEEGRMGKKTGHGFYDYV